MIFDIDLYLMNWFNLKKVIINICPLEDTRHVRDK